MKTLVPPPITPGPWHIGNPQTYATYNANQINSETVGICEVYGIPLHSTLEEVEKDKRSKIGLANAKFLSAAPAMAEALAQLVRIQGEDLPSHPAWKKALSALLSAGYTLKD